MGSTWHGVLCPGFHLAWGSVCVGFHLAWGSMCVGFHLAWGSMSWVPPGMGFCVCWVPPGMGFCVLGSTWHGVLCVLGSTWHGVLCVLGSTWHWFYASWVRLMSDHCGNREPPKSLWSVCVGGAFGFYHSVKMLCKGLSSLDNTLIFLITLFSCQVPPGMGSMCWVTCLREKVPPGIGFYISLLLLYFDG